MNNHTHTEGISLSQQVVVGVSLIGVSLISILGRNEPISYLFVGSIGLAFIYLLTVFLEWKGRYWIGVLAFSVLVLSIFWNTDKPLNGLAGLILVILTVLNAQIQEEEIDPIEELEKSIINRDNPPSA